jgi:organic radical activating enzyme
MKMLVKDIIDEDFANYKKPSMFIAFPNCTFKCEKECGVRCCQNSALAQQNNIEVDTVDIVERYVSNQISSAIVIGGLEPFDNYKWLLALISDFRKKTKDDIVIYTGYTKAELSSCLDGQSGTRNRWYALGKYRNIVLKFGRFVPNQEKHYDDVLGVYLASDNQYAERIS